MSKDEILVIDIGSVLVDFGRIDAWVSDWSRIGTRLALTFFDWRGIDIVFWFPLFVKSTSLVDKKRESKVLLVQHLST